MLFATLWHAARLPLLGLALLPACAAPTPPHLVKATRPGTAGHTAPIHLTLFAPTGTPPVHAAPVPADTSATGLASALADVRRRSYFLDPVAHAPAGRQAVNVAQHLTAQLGAATYTIAAATPPPTIPRPGQPTARATSSRPAWQVRFALRGIGRGGHLAFRPQALASTNTTDTTVSYTHGAAFTVDYLNSPAGVRQNYHLLQRPDGSQGPVQVLLDLGTRLRVRAEGTTALTFATAAGPVLRYADLRAWDATGRTLPAHLALQHGSHALALVVDDAQATYPITIDPLASTPSTTLSDPAATDRDNFGYSVAGAGDVNGDGYADVVVGAYGTSANQGRAYLYLGSSAGLRSTPAAALNDPTARSEDRFGASVAGAGDVNGDGYADVLIGAYGGDIRQGAAYLYLGSSMGLSGTPSLILNDPRPGSSNYFGSSVAGAGDVNGDGYADVLIGAYGFSGSFFFRERGIAYLYLGSRSGLSSTPTILEDPGGTPGDSFGSSVAGAGDVNGDGYADVLIGADGTNGIGRAYLYLGRSTGLNASPDATFFAPILAPLATGFGWSVAGAGDVNGDGYADVLIGDEGGIYYHGHAYLYLGRSTGVNTTPTTILTDPAAATNYNAFSASIAGAGDVNGDGYADVLVSAAGANIEASTNNGQGTTYLYLGSSTGLPSTPSATFADPAASNGDHFGSSVAGVGDVNGDGYADVLTGANGTTSSQGKAYLYLGSAGALLPNATTFVTDPVTPTLNSYGWSVASAGDVNGDGYADVLIGVTGIKVYLYLGSSAGLSATPSTTLLDPAGANPLNYYGQRVASAGDVNGDGYADVLVGAAGTNNSRGATYLYLGSSTGLNPTASTILFTTSSSYLTGPEFGYSLAGAGDVNGDGYADVLISAYAIDYYRGRTYLYLGSSTGLSTQPTLTLSNPEGESPDPRSAGSFFGYSVAGAGDVNGDGYADVLIGTNGRAFLYLGRSTGLTSIPSTTLTTFGFSVAGAGDVNGDGYADVLVGVYSASNFSPSYAYLYLGSRNGLSTVPSTRLPSPNTPVNDYFGFSVAGAGDLNGDGYADVLVGARLTGQAYVYLGRSTGLSTAPTLALSGGSQSLFGYQVAGAGDVNGDGYGDVLVGAGGTAGTLSAKGSASLYLGNEGGGRVGRLRLYNPDLTTPLSQPTVSTNQFGMGLVARSAFGRVRARLVWEAVGNGVAFSGVPITNSTAYSGLGAWTDVPAGPATELKTLVTKAGRTTRVRARLEYATASPLAATAAHNGTGGTGALPRYGPWTYVDAQQLGQSTNGATPLPVRGSATVSSLQLEAYPNPSQQQLSVRIEAQEAGPATLRLTDALGRVVLERALSLPQGRTTLVLGEARNLQPGLYLLQVRQGARRQSFSLVRQ